MDVIGVGYEGMTIEQFCESLQLLSVVTLVDVRLNALSRKRGFSKNGLRAALTEAGIAYVHLPQLGNPRENRDGFAHPRSRSGDPAREVYRQRLLTADGQAALREIRALAESGIVATMCFERDESACHRELVLDALSESVNVKSLVNAS